MRKPLCKTCLRMYAAGTGYPEEPWWSLSWFHFDTDVIEARDAHEERS